MLSVPCKDSYCLLSLPARRNKWEWDKTFERGSLALAEWLDVFSSAGLVFTVVCVTALWPVSIVSSTPPGVIWGTFFQDWLIFIMDEFCSDKSFCFVLFICFLISYLPLQLTRPCLDITQKWCLLSLMHLHGPDAAHQGLPLSGLLSMDKFFHPSVCKKLSLKNVVLGVRSVAFQEAGLLIISFLPHWHLRATENSQDKWMCRNHLFTCVSGHLLYICTRSSAV